mmetsp:Transcript_23000/g.45893  ORF Transcript_23000/g.45893 Transcript_23000/m.45893 type:complete len:273 (-) Transcript_23000:406-1224(-)
MTDKSTFKKVLHTAFADPSTALSFSNQKPYTELDPTFVKIQVSAASLNPIDYKLVTGALKFSKKPLPRGLGSDISRVVTEVGSECKRLKVGDEIYSDAIGFSPLSEVCVVPESKVSLKPAGMSFNEAATIPLAALTALQALRNKGGMKEGMKVAIFGGSGGVGSFAIQIAKALGAAEVATTSTNEDFCKGLGADIVVNYKTDNAGDKLKDFDIVFDTVGGIDHWMMGKKILKSTGTYVSIVGDGVAMGKMIGRGEGKRTERRRVSPILYFYT